MDDYHLHETDDVSTQYPERYGACKISGLTGMVEADTRLSVG